MSKPDSYPVPEAADKQNAKRRSARTQQEPLSGSKQVKQDNHSRHNNGEG